MTRGPVAPGDVVVDRGALARAAALAVGADAWMDAVEAEHHAGGCTRIAFGNGMVLVTQRMGEAADHEGRQANPDTVSVGREDLAVVLGQHRMHVHTRPGIWDPDNGPGLAGTACIECAARVRLQRAIGQKP